MIQQLNKLGTLVFSGGAILMAAGFVLYMVGAARSFSPWIYLVGAVCFGVMQMIQGYHGASLTIHRLRSIQILADLLFIAAGLLMVEDCFHLVKIPQLWYAQYVHNNWIVLVLIAAVLELYTTIRMGKELDKEAKKR